MMRALAALLALMVVAAGTAQILVTTKGRAARAGLRTAMGQEMELGSLQGLLKARVIGLRLVVANPADADVEADLSFVSALLAVDYALTTEKEAAAAAARAEAIGQPPPERLAVLKAVRALLAMRRGETEVARDLAEKATDGATEIVLPLLALGRVRALTGDLAGASRALEAARIKAPAFLEAAVAWAEVRLDLGDASAARSGLREVLERNPAHSRAWLLLTEAEQAMGPARIGAGSALDRSGEGCRRDGATSPAVAAACEITVGMRARLAGDRSLALEKAHAAGSIAPAEPRVLARTALLLGQLGAVDEAAGLVERALRHAGPTMAAVQWARLAVDLGRGGTGSPGRSARPYGAEERLLAARSALAVGGVGALTTILATFSPEALGIDPDLRLIRRMVPTGIAPSADGQDETGPVWAYVEGLRARLANDLPGAAQLLAQALEGHGDACRAAGEYVATLRALRRMPAPGEFASLRKENRRCANLSATVFPAIPTRSK